MPDKKDEKWMTQADQNILKGIEIVVENSLSPSNYKLEFQFPPRITSETKNPSWDEEDLFSYEPISIFMGSEARKLNVEIKYVVDSADGKFSPTNIANICRRLKSYAYNIGTDSEKAFPTLSISWPYILPGKAKVRLTDLNIDYSESMVGGEKDAFYPLMTTITFTMHVVTKIGGIVPANQLQGGKKQKGEPKQDAPGLPDFIRFEWM